MIMVAMIIVLPMRAMDTRQTERASHQQQQSHEGSEARTAQMPVDAAQIHFCKSFAIRSQNPEHASSLCQGKMSAV